jgi:hypothetical protein
MPRKELDQVLDEMFDELTEPLLEAERAALAADTTTPSALVYSQPRLARLFRPVILQHADDEKTTPVAYAWMRAQTW